MSDAPPAANQLSAANQPSATNHKWALILAAGEGSRLRALTTQPCGTPVPKQYSRLHIPSQDPDAEVAVLPSDHDVAAGWPAIVGASL